MRAQGHHVAVAGGVQGGHMRQHGGPVWPGGSFIVGEAGPELFVPSGAGNIVPNHELPAGPVEVKLVAADGPGGKGLSRTFVQMAQDGLIRLEGER